MEETGISPKIAKEIVDYLKLNRISSFSGEEIEIGNGRYIVRIENDPFPMRT